MDFFDNMDKEKSADIGPRIARFLVDKFEDLLDKDREACYYAFLENKW